MPESTGLNESSDPYPVRVIKSWPKIRIPSDGTEIQKVIGFMVDLDSLDDSADAITSPTSNHSQV